MIAKIEELFKLPDKQIKHFLKTCSIKEKICAYKFSVRILNQTNYKFYKGSRELTQDMIILNRIWADLIKEWTIFFINNPELVKRYIGHIFYGFYFPDEAPLNKDFVYSRYKSGKKYLIHNLTDFYKRDKTYDLNDTELFDVQKKFKLDNYDKINSCQDLIEALNNFETYSDKGKIYGWVLKNKSDKFQLQETENIHYESNKVPLELMLQDFVNYLEQSEYDNFVTSNYTESVCNIFEDYILNKNCHLEEKYRLTPEDLEAPYYGKYFGISYNNIPSEKTKALCQQNKLYENVFKVMLANFKRYKNYEDMVILSQRHTFILNNFIKIVKLKCRV